MKHGVFWETQTGEQLLVVRKGWVAGATLGLMLRSLGDKRRGIDHDC